MSKRDYVLGIIAILAAGHLIEAAPPWPPVYLQPAAPPWPPMSMQPDVDPPTPPCTGDEMIVSAACDDEFFAVVLAGGKPWQSVSVTVVVTIKGEDFEWDYFSGRLDMNGEAAILHPSYDAGDEGDFRLQVTWGCEAYDEMAVVCGPCDVVVHNQWLVYDGDVCSYHVTGTNSPDGRATLIRLDEETFAIVPGYVSWKVQLHTATPGYHTIDVCDWGVTAGPCLPDCFHSEAIDSAVCNNEVVTFELSGGVPGSRFDFVLSNGDEFYGWLDEAGGQVVNHPFEGILGDSTLDVTWSCGAEATIAFSCE